MLSFIGGWELCDPCAFLRPKISGGVIEPERPLSPVLSFLGEGEGEIY